ncbi:MAG: CopG family transcriptional regulator [Spirochaetes bacterium]|nr:CopG family transcriptional regulator [Spirochaetota bacterium]MBU0953967.1 CopG family transcriptional regulator [Spirochaetota bacterium]
MVETEKVTINMSAVDLGKVDLLVQEALYSNRSDFIRTAIRNLLDKHYVELQQAIVRQAFVVGVQVYTAKQLEQCKARKERLNITVVGYLSFARDITPELADEVIESVNIKGILDISPAVKAVLGERLS